jgi:hypothetical protein
MTMRDDEERNENREKRGFTRAFSFAPKIRRQEYIERMSERRRRAEKGMGGKRGKEPGKTFYAGEKRSVQRTRIHTEYKTCRRHARPYGPARPCKKSLSSICVALSNILSYNNVEVRYNYGT